MLMSDLGCSPSCHNLSKINLLTCPGLVFEKINNRRYREVKNSEFTRLRSRGGTRIESKSLCL